MAIEVTIESTIARPPDEVFAAIADLGRLADLAHRQRHPIRPARVRRAADDRRTGGRRAGRRGTCRHASRRPITALEPGRRLALRGRDAEGVTIDIDAVVDPATDGDTAATELRWTIRIGLPLRYRVFESMARPQVERAALLDIEGLRLAFERPVED